MRLYGIESRMPWIDGVSALPGEAMDAVVPEARKRSIVNHQHPPQSYLTRLVLEHRAFHPLHLLQMGSFAAQQIGGVASGMGTVSRAVR